MIKPYLKTKLNSKEQKMIGTHIEMTDSICSEVLGRVGFDFVVIDSDNSENSYTSLRNHMTALHSGGTPTVVRAASSLQSHVSRILELGPDGIILPGINTAQEAENAVSLCLYPPDGRRRFSPLRAVGYGLDDAMRYVKQDSMEMCRFIQLDSAEALRNLPGIIENDKIDGYFFSPGELMKQDGSPDGLYGPDTAALLSEAAALLKQENKPFGVTVMTSKPEILKFWVKLGADIIVSGTDFGYILEGAAENLRRIREL